MYTVELSAFSLTVICSNQLVASTTRVDVLDDIVTEYPVCLATDPLSSGAMAGIVILVLLVVLFLLCAVYMRYNHLYCFGEYTC